MARKTLTGLRGLGAGGLGPAAAAMEAGLATGKAWSRFTTSTPNTRSLWGHGGEMSGTRILGVEEKFPLQTCFVRTWRGLHTSANNSNSSETSSCNRLWTARVRPSLPLSTRSCRWRDSAWASERRAELLHKPTHTKFKWMADCNTPEVVSGGGGAILSWETPHRERPPFINSPHLNRTPWVSQNSSGVIGRCLYVTGSRQHLGQRKKLCGGEGLRLYVTMLQNKFTENREHQLVHGFP